MSDKKASTITQLTSDLIPNAFKAPKLGSDFDMNVPNLNSTSGIVDITVEPLTNEGASEIIKNAIDTPALKALNNAVNSVNDLSEFKSAARCVADSVKEGMELAQGKLGRITSLNKLFANE